MVTPSGSLSLSLTGLQALIAASTTWQNWVNPEDPDAGAGSVYIGGLPLPFEIDEGDNNLGYTPAQLALIRPFSLINFDTRASSHYEQLAQTTFLQSSRIMFSFEDAVSPGQDFRDAQIAFLNLVGGVLDDIQGLCGLDGLPNVQQIKIEKGITRADPKEIAARGDYHYMVLMAELGI